MREVCSSYLVQMPIAEFYDEYNADCQVLCRVKMPIAEYNQICKKKLLLILKGAKF